MRIALTLTAFAVAASPAAAVTIRGNGGVVVAGQTSQGLRSAFRTTKGSAEETFDQTGAVGTCKNQNSQLRGAFQYGDNDQDPTNPNDTQQFSLDVGNHLTGSPNGGHLQPGTNTGGNNSAPDTSCYAWGPNANVFDPGQFPNGDPSQALFGPQFGSPDNPLFNVYANFNPIRAATPVPNTYLGFYLGSIDPYNVFGLYSLSSNPDEPDQSPIIVPGLGDQTTGRFNGSDLINYLNTLGQGTYSLYESRYIEFLFTGSENFDHIGFGEDYFNRNWGTELDNLTVSSSTAISFNAGPGVIGGPVPEPAAIGLFGLGLSLVALRRRRAR